MLQSQILHEHVQCRCCSLLHFEVADHLWQFGLSANGPIVDVVRHFRQVPFDSQTDLTSMAYLCEHVGRCV